MMGVRYTICHWAINRTNPQNSLSMTLDVPLQGPKWASGGVRGDKIRLELVDINLQTEELHCNYLVLIGSLK